MGRPLARAYGCSGQKRCSPPTLLEVLTQLSSPQTYFMCPTHCSKPWDTGMLKTDVVPVLRGSVLSSGKTETVKKKIPGGWGHALKEVGRDMLQSDPSATLAWWSEWHVT